MTLLTPDVLSAAALHRGYMESRRRWLDSALVKTLEKIQAILLEGCENGWWETDEELKDRFGISRPMAQRIRAGNYDDLGRQIVFALAVNFGIDESGLSFGTGEKRKHLLKDMLPLFNGTLLTLSVLNGPLSVDAVSTAIDKMRHIEWESRTDLAAFHRWLGGQKRRFPEHDEQTIGAAGLWLAYRPQLPNYPDLLLRFAQQHLCPAEYQTFHDDVEIVGKLRRAALRAQQKCHVPLSKPISKEEKAEFLLETMSCDLSILIRRRHMVALGLLRWYRLELEDLLTWTHGELLEKSTTLRAVLHPFLS